MVSEASRASKPADFRSSRRAESACVICEVDFRAFGLALVRRHLAERCEQRGDRAFFAERRDAHGLKRGFVTGQCDVVEDIGFKFGEVGH